LFLRALMPTLCMGRPWSLSGPKTGFRANAPVQAVHADRLPTACQPLKADMLRPAWLLSAARLTPPGGLLTPRSGSDLRSASSSRRCTRSE
jgi:hypothetical protein